MAEEAEHSCGLMGSEEVGVGVLGWIIFLWCLVGWGERFGGEVVEVGGGGDLERERSVGPAYYTRVGLEDGGVDRGFADTDGGRCSGIG